MNWGQSIMGWDTQIIIIVENTGDKALTVASEIFREEARDYFGNGVSFVKYRDNGVLCVTYERRKYLPYWAIQVVSKNHPQMHFTVVASCPDYVAGPAGLVKIIDGEIIDSYGFFKRAEALMDAPRAEALYQWFGRNGLEEKYRELYTESHPRKWVEDSYVEHLIEFSDEEVQELDKLAERASGDEEAWKEISLDQIKIL